MEIGLVKTKKIEYNNYKNRKFFFINDESCDGSDRTVK